MVLRWKFASALFVGLAWSCQPTAADDALLASAMMPGTDLQASLDVLESNCVEMEQFENQAPRLPTTVTDEAFVRCEMPHGVIGLSYSDGSLVLAQLQGTGIVEALTADQQAAEVPVIYAGLEIYLSSALAVGPAADRAWLLSPTHLHAHLFLFEHPLLMDVRSAALELGFHQLLPPGVEIGIGLTEARAVLSSQCPLYEEREITPTTLPGNPHRQIQSNCFGLDVAGFPRKAEFIFGDGRLDLVWILTGAEEQARLEDHLTHLYGAQTGELDNYILWPSGLALRQDVPEIMIASPEVAAALTGP